MSEYLMDDENEAKAIDEVGQVADSIDNLVAALSMPLPDKMHVEQMRQALPDLSERLKRAYREFSGDDPWA